MSILNRLRLDSHLDDAAIAAVWAGSTLEGRPVSDRHLEACAACRARVDEFSGWLAQVRVEGMAEADDRFPADRLALQHAQIVRRLEVADRPPRVIAFPKASAPLTSRSSHASRWIAAAAAAGLIVGVGVGQVMDLRQAIGGEPAGVEARLSVQPPVAAAPVPAATGGDEAFLSELDASLARPSVPELRAIDDFTPRAGEQPR